MLSSQKARVLERLFFFAVILLLPVQLGKHFWPPFAFVSGLPVDYLSPTLYLTDILLALAVVLRVVKDVPAFLQTLFRVRVILIMIALFLATNILLAKNSTISIFASLKFLEVLSFSWLVYLFFRTNKERGIRSVGRLFIAGGIFESLLALLQVLRGGSLGGPLYLLGERSFTSVSPGIANAVVNGELLLRPYGTFPHPNVLAFYLLVCISFLFFFQEKKSSGENFFFFFSLTLCSLGIFLTLSRVVIGLFVVLLFLFLLKFPQKKTKALSYLVLVFVALVFAFLAFGTNIFFRFTTFDHSLSLREDLAVTSLSMFSQSPLFGVGLQNFLPLLPLYQKTKGYSLFESMQPVHNTYLLVLAETGLLGAISVGLFLYKTVRGFIVSRSIFSLPFVLFCLLLVVGFFDHYPLTLQQGQLLTGFILGFVCARQKKNRILLQ